MPTPQALAISAHPNPFNSFITIYPYYRIESPKALSTIELFDVNGRCVAQLPVGEGFTPALSDDSVTNARDGARPSPTKHEFVWRPDESLGPECIPSASSRTGGLTRSRWFISITLITRDAERREERSYAGALERGKNKQYWLAGQ